MSYIQENKVQEENSTLNEQSKPKLKEQSQEKDRLLLSKNKMYKILNNYILQNKIGSGSFGQVYKVKHKITGEIFAAKISINNLQVNSDNMILDIYREVNIIAKLEHPLVIKFIFFSPYNFKGKQKPVIITEYAENGSLDKLLENEQDKTKESILNDTKKLIIIYGIAEAMSYLHSHTIIHRDLKPGNILLDESLYPKIADFGISKVNHSINSMSINNEIKGTPLYMAPEIWEKSQYSKSSDVYAFAFIIYEIITNERPFKNVNFFQLPVRICNGERPGFKMSVPISYQKLIESCWSPNPQDRPTFDQILIYLGNDRGFITDSVDRNEYENYIKYINQCKISFDSTKNYLYLYKLNDNNSNVRKLLKDQELTPKIYPYQEYFELDEKCKQIIDTAENNCEKLYIIAKSLIEGYDSFPLNLDIGLQYLKESIKQNHIKSIIYYCKLIIKGKVIPIDLKKAKKLIGSKMKHDKSMYLYLLGKIHLKKKQYEKAKNNFQESFQIGNDESMYEYGKMIYNGKGFLIDKNQSIKYFEGSIKSGNVRAKYKYGKMLLNNEILGKTKEEGINYIKQSADQGYLKAMYYYSLMLDKGDDIPANKELAINLLKESANKGYMNSMYQYGLYLQNEYKNKRKSTKEFIQYFKKAAYKGHIDSIYEYGMIFYNGDVVPVDKEVASTYLRITANKGNSSAMAYFGKMLLSGDGVLADKEEALKYIKKGISRDNQFALYFYASMLKDGKDIPKNIEEAVKYYKMAIDKGNSDAMADYADMLNRGDNVPKNVEEATKYYKMAIDKGHSGAMNSYALILYNACDDNNGWFDYLLMSADNGNIFSMYLCGFFFRNGYRGVTTNKKKSF